VTTFPTTAWANDTTSPGGQLEYIIDPPVGANQWVAITLCWDRHPNLSSVNDTYHYGDQFFPYDDPYEVMADLDLLLVRTTNDEIVAASNSLYYTTEHIFFKTTAIDQYKIVVQYNGGLEEQTTYGLAWQFGDYPLAPVQGDFNGDGAVNAADYVVWRNDPAGHGGPGGYDTWRTNFGAIAGNGSVAVPEPTGTDARFDIGLRHRVWVLVQPA
jgi:hypothetical protein